MLQMTISYHSEWEGFLQVVISAAKQEKINFQNCTFITQMPSHHLPFLMEVYWRGEDEEGVEGMRKED